MNCRHSKQFQDSTRMVFEVVCAGDRLISVAKLFDRFIGRPSTSDDGTVENLAAFVGHLIDTGNTCYSLGMIDLAVNRLKPEWRRSLFMAPVRSCSRSRLKHAP